MCKKLEILIMNKMFKTSGIVLATLLLAACGSDDHHDDHDHGDEHEHESALLISENDGSFSVIEEGETDDVIDTDTVSPFTSGASLLLASNGEMAAAISVGAIKFIVAHHEDGSEEAYAEVRSISALADKNITEVINTRGHFSVLVDGRTQLIPYASLEEGEVPEAEALNFSDIVPGETHPAVLLEETESKKVVLAFDERNDNAIVYKVTDGVESIATKTCEGLESVAQNAEFTLVSCGTETFVVKIDGETITFPVVSGISTATEWKTAAGVFVGLGDDDNFYVVEEENEALVLVDAGQNSYSFSAPENLCGDGGWAIDSSEADVFALEPGKLTVFDHEGGSTPVSLPNSTGACADLYMAAGSKAVYVLDTAANILFEIDKEESVYHVHNTEIVTSNVGVNAMVLFHEIVEEAGHAH